MQRTEFETAAREQNARHAADRAIARETGAACNVVTMFAFGGESYCTTHGVMGECPYGAGGAR